MLTISAADRDQIEADVRAGYPYETCGLLLGRSDGALATVLAVRAARNLNTSRAEDRFELDPNDQLAAEMEARARGWDVIGVWHAHPDHPARPSETDRAHAWAGYAYVIVSVCAGGIEDFRSWRLDGDGFVEEPIVTNPPEAEQTTEQTSTEQTSND